MAKLFKSPDMPKVEDPKPIPQADDEMIEKARKRRIAKESNTSGVQSTLLTAGGRETLGG